MFSYRLLIPISDDNVVLIKDKDFPISEISKINIDIRWDKASYWFSLMIDDQDMHSLTILRKLGKSQAILILGDNRFEIHGDLEVLNSNHNKQKEAWEFDCAYIADNVRQMVNFPRRITEVKRTDLIDLSKD